jgi:hypothetical protein
MMFSPFTSQVRCLNKVFRINQDSIFSLFQIS